MREPREVRVRVVTGTQVSYGGTTHLAGSEVSAPADIAERWIVRGWVEPIEAREPKTATGSTRVVDVRAATGRSRGTRTA